MSMRVVMSLCVLAFAGNAHADLINTDFNANLSGWTSTSVPGGLGSWQWASGSLLAGGSAELELLGPSGTISLSQTFTLTGFDPSRVETASLSWTHYLNAVNPNAWGLPDQRFRVLLTDQSLGQLVAFTTDGPPAQPAEIGTQGPGMLASANSGDLVAFLSQLTLGEQLTLTFEAFTTFQMQAAVDNVQFNFTLSAVPEPGSMALTGLAGGVIVAMRKRRRSKSQRAVLQPVA